jgi:hypothetical protein
MNIKVEKFDFKDASKNLTTLEIQLEDGATLMDYSCDAEEFIAVVDREESVKLCADLMRRYAIHYDELRGRG